MSSRLRIWWFVVIALAVCPQSTARGQSNGIPIPPPPTSGGLAPVPGASTVPTAPTLGAPTFDPFTSGAPSLTQPPPPNMFGTPPAGTAPTTAPWNQMPTNPPAGTYSSPYGSPQPWGSPASSVPGASPYGTPTSPYGAAPYGATPGSPQGESLFPNGIFPQSPNGSQPPVKLFDNLRIRETWIYGDGNQQLGINDIETAVTMMLPHFLGTTTPLMLSPNFALHLWDGPAPPSHTQFMPGNAYSAYLEAAYNTDHAKPLGVDLAASVGVFTDFETMTTDSVRIQTLSYFWARLTPTMMIKLGVDYLDRVDVKILPAVGILYEPNPQTKLDIFFPRPKLAHLFNTVGTTDIWWYLAGEYGGGSWTIHNDIGNYVDQVDINDIRIMLGFDWSNQSGVRGMIEVGWVMQRELVYRNTPSDNTGLSDSFMLRGGLAF